MICPSTSYGTKSVRNSSRSCATAMNYKYMRQPRQCHPGPQTSKENNIIDLPIFQLAAQTCCPTDIKPLAPGCQTDPLQLLTFLRPAVRMAKVSDSKCQILMELPRTLIAQHDKFGYNSVQLRISASRKEYALLSRSALPDISSSSSEVLDCRYLPKAPPAGHASLLPATDSDLRVLFVVNPRTRCSASSSDNFIREMSKHTSERLSPSILPSATPFWSSCSRVRALLANRCESLQSSASQAIQSAFIDGISVQQPSTEQACR